MTPEQVIRTTEVLTDDQLFMFLTGHAGFTPDDALGYIETWPEGARGFSKKVAQEIVRQDASKLRGSDGGDPKTA